MGGTRGRVGLGWASVAVFGLVFATSLSCRTATQIKVTVTGNGFDCENGEGVVRAEDVGVLAQAILDASTSVTEDFALASECKKKGKELDFGNVVLVPSDDPGSVEVLAIAGLRSDIEGEVGDASVESCRAIYDARRDEPTFDCAADAVCRYCIFARRSLSFVAHSELSLPIRLDNDCRGVLCGSTATCIESTCVSAATVCGTTGDCSLEVGEGGSGDGGGGEGGAGGGGGSDPWQSFSYEGHDPPVDVVGYETTAGPVRVHVAAGTDLVTFDDGIFVPDESRLDDLPRTFEALSVVANDPVRAVALGVKGLSTSGSRPPFSVPGSFPPPWSTAAAAQASRYSIAGRDGSSPDGLAAVWSYDGPDGAVTSNFAGGSGAFAGTLFTVELSAGPSIALASHGRFLSWQPTTVSLPLQDVEFFDTNETHLWGTRVGQNALFLGTSESATEVLRAEVTPLHAIMSGTIAATSEATIADIWGETTMGGVRLWAVGEENGEAWLGSMEITASDTGVWTPRPLPSEVVQPGDVTSIWVGAGRIVLVGPAGVFGAGTDELE